MNLWPKDANIGLFLYSTWLPFTCLTLPHSLSIVVSIQTVLAYYKSLILAHNFSNLYRLTFRFVTMH
jgi:hypothetical protein